MTMSTAKTITTMSALADILETFLYFKHNTCDSGGKKGSRRERETGRREKKKNGKEKTNQYELEMSPTHA